LLLNPSFVFQEEEAHYQRHRVNTKEQIDPAPHASEWGTLYRLTPAGRWRLTGKHKPRSQTPRNTPEAAGRETSRAENSNG